VSWSSHVPATLAVGLGDPGLERQVLSALDGEPTVSDQQVSVARRCMTAGEVLACLRQGDADAAVVGTGLQGLGADAADALRDLGMPVVVLVPAGGEEWWRVRLPAARLLSVGRTLDAALVRRAVAEALRERQGSRLATRLRASTTGSPAGADASSSGPGAAEFKEPSSDGPTWPRPPAGEPTSDGRLIGVLGPPGGPGVTTTAINVAALLGRQASTLLIDLHVDAASVASCLDLDSRRNVYMLAYAAPQDAAGWQRAFDLEVQPLHPSSPQGSVLAGLPTTLPGLRVGRPFVDILLREALRRWSFVVVDAGLIPLHGAMAGLESVVVGAAHQLLVVSGCDLVSLQRTQVGLEQLRGSEAVDQRLLLVANRHDARYHHDRVEIGRVLEAPVAALVPEDRAAAQRALRDQQPLVAGTPRSRTARAFAEVVGVLVEGKQVAPVQPPQLHMHEQPGAARERRRRWPSSAALPAMVGRLVGSLPSRPQVRLP